MDESDRLPPTISVAGEYFEEQVATSVRLQIDVIGSSLFSAHEAMKRAVELRELLEVLKAQGIDEDKFRLIDIRVDSRKGMFSRNSKVHYVMSVLVEAIDNLPDILIAITEPKHVSIDRMAWQYEDERDEEAWIKQAFTVAKSKADLIVGQLGARITGIATVGYRLSGNDEEEVSYGERPGARHRAAASVDKLTMDMSIDAEMSVTRVLATSLIHSRRVGVLAEISYEIELVTVE
ncbi:MAG: SIMPL domain-containing protein [Planctomycetota bacterium]